MQTSMQIVWNLSRNLELCEQDRASLKWLLLEVEKRDSLREKLTSVLAANKNWTDLHERAILQRNDYAAQLRAAKEEIVRLNNELACKQRELGLLREENARMVVDFRALDMLAGEQLSTATAQVADLRAALADIQRNDLGRTVAHTIATNALARTPATSLAAHDAAVLRGLAEECEEVMPGDLPHITQNRLREMADQIEAEAKVVKDGR